MIILYNNLSSSTFLLFKFYIIIFKLRIVEKTLVKDKSARFNAFYIFFFKCLISRRSYCEYYFLSSMSLYKRSSNR